MGIIKSYRKTPPAHYKLKIESFSILSQAQIEKYETEPFEAGGYKWKLRLFPNGNIYNGGKGHLSLYLIWAGNWAQDVGEQVKISFKMFMFNHNQDKYLVIQDDVVLSHFHDMKPEWGVDKLLSLDDLNDMSSGFLSEDDSCIFGVEVFVVKYSGRGESLSIVKDPKTSVYTWTISNMNTLDMSELLYSDIFVAGEQYWKLSIYPHVKLTSGDRSLSIHLNVVDWGISSKEKLLVDYKLRLKNQLGKSDYEKQATQWFSSSSPTCGFEDFISYEDLTDLSKGFQLVNTIVVEVEITFMSEITDFAC